MLMTGGVQQDITADYWRAYFEWRSAYGLADDCMHELLAAVRVAIESPATDAAQQARLQVLARMLATELGGAVARAA